MIIKGQARGRAKQLAFHLLRADQNERIDLFECRGTLAHDVEGALLEMEARGTVARTQSPLYHASVSPEAATPLTAHQIAQAVDLLEAKLGLHGQPRIVVVHRKKEREHIHVVWSRIEVETGNAVSYSWNYRLHEQVARELEMRFGHRLIESSQGARRRQGSRRTVKDYEMRQAERSGKAPSTVSGELTRLWNASATGAAFRRQLEKAGYILAQGDRRVFVVIDGAGNAHSLARRINGVGTDAIRNKLQDISLADLPPVSIARERIKSGVQAVIPRKFVAAAREVARSDSKAPIYATLVQARANIRHMLTPDITRQPTTAIVGRERTPFGSGKPNAGYRSARAALIGEYARRVAEALRSAPREELDAILEALRAEQAAAVAALGVLHGHGRVRRVGSSRTQHRGYRKKFRFKLH